MKFNIKRRLLTKEEKLRRTIFFFAYALPDFNIIYGMCYAIPICDIVELIDMYI